MGSLILSGLTSVAQIPLTLLSDSGLNGNLWPKQATLEDNASYDYIVVGGGTAGSVVSRRLAEDRNHTVLMVEEGGNPPLPALIPLFFNLLPHSSVDHDYTSTRDDYASRGQNNYTMITAGKMLGGSASLNHFIHSRGCKSDFDCWANHAKDNSWKYENILQYFKKSESVADDDEILGQYGEFHGTKGPTGLTRQPEKELVDILEAFAEVGNPTVLDLNADKCVGYTQPQYMLADNKRQTPGYTYLKPVKDFSNLHVSKHTTVTRIIFEGNIAVAIEAVYKGKTYTFRAKKEIILCAGVFNTPQILMLSGIGPKEHLESFNIKVLKDLPVGNNLVDQVSVTVVHKLKKHLFPIPIKPLVKPNPFRFPFPTIVGSVALNKSQTCPDVQSYNLFFERNLPFLTIACATVFGLRSEICDRWQKQVKNRDCLYTVLALLQPKSRGTVRLGSDDPLADPVITTGYYTHKDDLIKMVNIVKDFISVGGTKYLKKNHAELAGLDLPECAGKEKGSDEFWICYILNHSGSPYHFTGTCPMGEVVDGKLKVKGVENLRVVDASVIPDIPRAAPNAAVLMLAEKASADILNDDN